MQRLAAFGYLVVALVWSLFAQSATPRPSFEVASIKVDDIPQTYIDMVPRRSGDRVIMHNTRLRMVVAYAYHLTNPSWQIAGNVNLPDGWNWYDIEAIAPGSTSEDDLRLMFQFLLEDRFQLRVHREARALTGYDLVVGKSGSKLKPAKPEGKLPGGEPDPPSVSLVAFGTDGARLTGNGSSIEQLVTSVSERLGVPIRDRTDLTGLFDYDFVFAREDKVSDFGGPPVLATAIQEDLGLRLEKNKSQVQVLVVDHVAKPSPN